MVLLLWVGCFLHCSSEQFEIRVVSSLSSNHAEILGESDLPCELCDFVTIGGVPTVSSLRLAVPLYYLSEEVGLFFSLTPNSEKTDEPPSKFDGADHFLPPLCEVLVRAGLPVRGPTAV